jgi:hypothetical protein
VKADEAPSLSLKTGETTFGYYQNLDGSVVAFTSEGLHLERHGLVRYRDIVEARVVGDKATASRIELSLSDGKSVVAEFQGGRERFRDVWEILRLLNRICAVVPADDRIEAPDSERPPTPRG